MGSAARHFRPLVGRAREAGLAVVMATQGLTDLRATEPALVDQVLQDTAWQIGFRQGGPTDARLMQDLFGMAWVEDVARSSNGVSTYRQVQRPRVPVDEWMNDLQPGDAWVRVAPIDGRWRQTRVRVAMPRRAERKQVSETALGNTVGNHVRGSWGSVSDMGVSESPAPASDMVSARGELRRAPYALPAVPPDCPAELTEKMGADVLAKVDRLWPTRHHHLGPCLVWREGEPTIQSAGNVYGRLYDPSIKRSDAAHRVAWRRVYGPIPDGPDGKPLEVDHLCEVTLCVRPDHLNLKTKRDNVAKRGPTRGPNKRPAEPAAAPAEQQFAIALFDRIARPQFKARTATLDELATMLTRFEVLPDKHLGRCWSPTAYMKGRRTRKNDGVESVSCLVFDCDRVADPIRGACRACTGSATRRTHTRSRRHGGASSSRSLHQCPCRPGATCGDELARRCARRRTRPARIPAARTGCQRTTAVWQRRCGSTRARCWIHRRCPPCRPSRDVRRVRQHVRASVTGHLKRTCARSWTTSPRWHQAGETQH